jgi:predicted lipoprotein with Yx(FWY)xxD motif
MQRGATMKTFIKLTVLAVLMVAVVGAGTAFAEHHAVKVAQKEGIGSYLTDIRGMTLYNFKNDTPGKSACEGPCVDNWPLFYREKVDAKDGLAAGDFGTITRPDGKKQTVYKGMPLYYFIKDVKPGDTNGQGFKDLWSVAKP